MELLPAYEIRHTIFDTPLGPLMLVHGEAGAMRVAFEKENFATVLVKIAHVKNVESIKEDTSENIYTHQISEYLVGAREAFDVPLDYSLSTPFQRLVQNHLLGIPYGGVESYKQVATGVENPKAVRAVGRACATNPLPLVIPCHRVLNTNGTLGGYLNGSDSKRLLLDLEKSSV